LRISLYKFSKFHQISAHKPWIFLDLLASLPCNLHRGPSFLQRRIPLVKPRLNCSSIAVQLGTEPQIGKGRSQLMSIDRSERDAGDKKETQGWAQG